jgi:hypothetical protein
LLAVITVGDGYQIGGEDGGENAGI